MTALRPTSYSCSSTNNISSCNLALTPSSPFDSLAKIATAQCGFASDCNFSVIAAFDSTTQIFSATVKNSSSTFHLADRDIIMQIPPEVFYSGSVNCPAATPFFSGYNLNGTMNCKSLADFNGGTQPCPAGQFISQFDSGTLKFTCISFASDISCPSPQILASYQWQNGQFTQTCMPPASAAAYYAYTAPPPTHIPPNINTIQIAGCTGTPWGNVASGFSGTAYAAATSSNCASIAESRTCFNGTMSGSYTNLSCTAPPPPSPPPGGVWTLAFANNYGNAGTALYIVGTWAKGHCTSITYFKNIQVTGNGSSCSPSGSCQLFYFESNGGSAGPGSAIAFKCQ